MNTFNPKHCSEYRSIDLFARVNSCAELIKPAFGSFRSLTPRTTVTDIRHQIRDASPLPTRRQCRTTERVTFVANISGNNISTAYRCNRFCDHSRSLESARLVRNRIPAGYVCKLLHEQQHKRRLAYESPHHFPLEFEEVL
jgi:hypothetical protein